MHSLSIGIILAPPYSRIADVDLVIGIVMVAWMRDIHVPTYSSKAQEAKEEENKKSLAH